MNEQELIRWRIIEDVLNKKITQKEAATSLAVSERQLRNLLTAYKNQASKDLYRNIETKLATTYTTNNLKIKYYRC